MALDKEKCSKLQARVESLIAELGEDSRKRCFEEGRLRKLDDSLKKFKEAFEEAQKEGRKLRIGIIGSVKAGKSSFLNTLFFKGKDRLPKAATPMTAALTIISYSEEPHARIHYYDKSSWNDIEQYAKEYDAALEAAYNEYLEEYKKKLEEYKKKEGKAGKGLTVMPPRKMDKATFEKQAFRKIADTKLLSSKELCIMAKQREAELREKKQREAEQRGVLYSQNLGTDSYFQKLGNEDKVKEDELENYIGANGIYTPIVSYVELFINDKEMEGVEIIDTPGLNDPIVSRSEATLRYLSKVDVAILLSPTGQFMDSSTFGLMIKAFPANGINNIIVVGSKVDTGMITYKESGVSIKRAYSATVYSCKDHLERITREYSATYPKECEQISKSPVIFISSLLGSIAYKKENGESLNEDEMHIYQILSKRFTEFDDSANFMYALSGFREIKAALKKVQQEKEEIINKRNSELYQRYTKEVTVILQEMRDDAFDARDRLENSDIKEQKKKKEAIISTLESVRSKLSHMCKMETDAVVRRAELLKTRLDREETEKPAIHEKTEHRSSTSRELLIFKKTEHWDEHISYVIIADAQTMIRNFIGKINEQILTRFNSIISTDDLVRKAKEIVIPAMNKYSDASSYNESDILNPLKETISKLSTIEIRSIKQDEYINKLKAAYKKDTAEGNDIGKFMGQYEGVIGQIIAKAQNFIDEQIDNIKKTLPCCMDDFIDKLKVKFDKQIKQLDDDMTDKKASVERYNAFMKYIDECKAEFKD